MHAIEEAQKKILEDTTVISEQDNPLNGSQPDQEEDELSLKVLIVDVMAILQCMTKTPTMVKISDLQNAFNKRIEKMVEGYVEGHIIFDRYKEESLKNKTRQKRATTSVEYEIHPEMRLTMSIKDLLSSSSTKKRLTCMLAEGLLEHFSKEKFIFFRMVVVYDTFIKESDSVEIHTHEEADTLIPHQVLVSVTGNPNRKIDVFSPDTDVLLLLINLVSQGQIGAPTSLTFITGVGTKRRKIDIFERVEVIGHRKGQGLLGLHNFSGSDWGGKFVGISKKTWMKAYMNLSDDNPALDSFKKLGESPIPSVLVEGAIPEKLKP